MVTHGVHLASLGSPPWRGWVGLGSRPSGREPFFHHPVVIGVPYALMEPHGKGR